MNKTSSVPTLSRRDFLKLTAAAGALVVGGHLLDTYAPWLNTEEQAALARQPYTPEDTMPQHMREMVRYATLAANGHNTQPWKFALRQDAIEIHPDTSRHLPVVDPENRELWISLGCALENLLLAARAVGYAPTVAYPDADEIIRVQLAPDAPQASPLFDAIPVRQTTRSVYDGRSVPAADLDTLQSLPLEPGVSLRFLTAPAEMETALEYVNAGNLQQYADRAFVDELIAWLRFNKKEAMATLDGLYSRCSGNPTVPRWLGRMFVESTKPQQQADADAEKLRSSAGAVVATDADDKAAWVRAGQVYERLALQMTALDLKSALLNQPIEVTELRPQFQTAIGLNAAPQLLVRFGYADALPRSLRRPVENVLI
ncbi:MAG TPA: twin-arginine translocation signal domain-containing protein [Anaerolineae bacterium]|nr:twin-arginine translocation signal domain-containing protein [Anaerolineae bacterium]HQI85624.1 twin-arginine translocation signal domain-containing protein [Anaerolineae bacterium]